jgi:hypothetical protein
MLHAKEIDMRKDIKEHEDAVVNRESHAPKESSHSNT